MDRLTRGNVRAVEVIDVQDRAMRDEGRVRPVAGRLAGPDFNGRLRGDNTEHRAAAHRPGSHGGFPVAGRAAQLIASPARLADHGPVDMAAATVGEGAGRSRTLRTGEAARGVLHVHLGFGHGRPGYPLPSNSCAPRGKCGGPDGRRATGLSALPLGESEDLSLARWESPFGGSMPDPDRGEYRPPRRRSPKASLDDPADIAGRYPVFRFER